MALTSLRDAVAVRCENRCFIKASFLCVFRSQRLHLKLTALLTLAESLGKSVLNPVC